MGAVIESAVNWAVKIANDNSHGYDQNNRWGPNYDCSSLVISAFEQAGCKVKSGGASFIIRLWWLRTMGEQSSMPQSTKKAKPPAASREIRPAERYTREDTIIIRGMWYSAITKVHRHL